MAAADDGDAHRRGRRTPAAGAARRGGGRARRDRVATRAPTGTPPPSGPAYLLDAVVDSATGLRRELGLPAVDGSPGDAVEAGLAGARRARRRAPRRRRRCSSSCSRLPHARLIVDGYNVTKAAWPTASLEAQRSRLVAALGPVVARSGAETTVVFDAAESTARTVMPAPRGVRVVFSPEGVIADDVIRQLVAAEPRGRVVVVVSGDQAVARDVTRDGARAVPASVLIDLVTT